MVASLRFYLFAPDGLYRISMQAMERLVNGELAMPQYASTRQKLADILLECENDKPIRIVQTAGSFLTFDRSGKVQKALKSESLQAIKTNDALSKPSRQLKSNVADLSPMLNRRKWEREHRWTLPKDDLNVIVEDLWS